MLPRRLQCLIDVPEQRILPHLIEQFRAAQRHQRPGVHRDLVPEMNRVSKPFELPP